MPTMTLLEGDEAHEVEGYRADGGLRLSAGDVEAVTGWHLEARGLCREGVCVPVEDRERLEHDGYLDLRAFADVLDRPLAADVREGVACLGESEQRVEDLLDTMEAPDFTLPDLEGREHSLSDYRGHKVLLIAHASW